jgi:hypothetical protein
MENGNVVVASVVLVRVGQHFRHLCAQKNVDAKFLLIPPYLLDRSSITLKKI